VLTGTQLRQPQFVNFGSTTSSVKTGLTTLASSTELVDDPPVDLCSGVVRAASKSCCVVTN
jgi:hypothetical protein